MIDFVFVLGRVVACRVWGCGWVDVKTLFFLRVCRSYACVVGGSFRASCLGLSVSLLLRFGGEWVDLKTLFLLGCVARRPASWETRLGRRVSDCFVAFKVWGWVDGC